MTRRDHCWSTKSKHLGGGCSGKLGYGGGTGTLNCCQTCSEEGRETKERKESSHVLPMHIIETESKQTPVHPYFVLQSLEP